MNWQSAAADITPSIVKIETPSGSGTGFLYMYTESGRLCGVATALHVVDGSVKWQEPIQITHYVSGESVFLEKADRVVFTDRETDSAVILFDKGNIPFPDDIVTLLPASTILPIGEEVAWLGFPAIEPSTLCLFSGNISAHQQIEKSYIIDGVSIHGLSGGPVFCILGSIPVMPRVIGIVSSYKANRTTGESLPGLLYAHDVSHFHKIVARINSLEEAERKKEELSKQKPEKTQEPPSEPTEPPPQDAQ